jgi:L-rhamnose 1-dehydrogenase
MSALPFLLTDKVLAITGGLTGIGRAIAISFLSHGAKVAVNYLPSHHAHNNDDELIASLKVEAFNGLKSRLSNHRLSTNMTSEQLSDMAVIFIPGDISQPTTSTQLIAQTVSTFKRLDIFISNAGICKFEEFLFIDPPLFQTHINTNLCGPSTLSNLLPSRWCSRKIHRAAPS